MEKVVIRRAKISELKIIQDLNYALFKSDARRDEFLNHQWPYEEGKEYLQLEAEV